MGYSATPTVVRYGASHRGPIGDVAPLTESGDAVGVACTAPNGVQAFEIDAEDLVVQDPMLPELPEEGWTCGDASIRAITTCRCTDLQSYPFTENFAPENPVTG